LYATTTQESDRVSFNEPFSGNVIPLVLNLTTNCSYTRAMTQYNTY